MLATLLLLPLHFFVGRASPVAARCSDVTYRGLYQDRVETFLGVQYGCDTGGENRFRPPQPYVPRPGTVIDATDPGPACPQAEGAYLLPLYLGNVTNISEDCLRLNIARPNGTTAGSKLPVMVYIHGGSFYAGSKDDPVSRPAGLIINSVANGHPIIHVNINYRLGVFGFAKSKALNKDGSENAGLRDQRLALEWVHDNIAAFGGDSNKITIHGQSSGGLAIGMQVMAYGGSKPAPFQQAIAQSQALEAGITGDYTRNAMSRVAKATGCNYTDLQSQATIKCFRKLSMQKLLEAEVDTHGSDQHANIGDEWLPVVDGDFLPAAPSELINTGRFYNVSMIIGWCENDVTYFIDPSDVSNATGVRSYFRAFLPNYSEHNLDTLLSLYPISDYHTSYLPNGTVQQSASFYRAGDILREIVMVCQPIFYGRALAKAGNSVYYYAQNQTILTPILHYLDSYGYGVVHTSEFAYTFGSIPSYNIYNYPYHPRAIDFALQTRESNSWSSFAAIGRPSIKGKKTLQGWKEADFEDENFGVYVIGGPKEGYAGKGGRRATRKAIAMEKLQEKCGFLNRPDSIRQQGF